MSALHGQRCAFIRVYFAYCAYKPPMGALAIPAVILPSVLAVLKTGSRSVLLGLVPSGCCLFKPVILVDMLSAQSTHYSTVLPVFAEAVILPSMGAFSC